MNVSAEAAAILARARGHGVRWSLIDQSLVSAMNFLTVLLLSRELPLHTFGVTMIAQTGLLLATGIQNAVIAQPHNILGARLDPAGFARFTRAVAGLQLALSVALACAVCAAGWLLARWVAKETGAIVAAIGLILVPWLWQEFARRALYTRGEARRAAIVDAVGYGGMLGAVVLLLVLNDPAAIGPRDVLFAIGAAALAGSLVGTWQLWPWLAASRGDLSRVALAAAWRDSWSIGRWQLTQQLLVSMGASAHGWVLAAFVGAERYGLYRAAYQIVNVLNPLRQAAMNYLPPVASVAYAQRGLRGLSAWTRRVSIALIVPFGAAALVLALGAPWAVELIYASRFDIALLSGYIALGALAFFLNVARTGVEYAVLASGGARALCLRTAWITSQVLILGVPLIYLWGAYGALASEIAIALVSLVLTVGIFRRQVRSAEAAT